MAQLVLPITLANGTTADADEVMTDFNAIKTKVNGNLQSDNFSNSAILSSTQHGVITATDIKHHKAAAIGVTDSGTYWTTDDVQSVIDQIAPFVGTGGSLATGVTRIKLADFGYHATVANSCEVTIAANDAPNGVVLLFGVNLGNSTGNSFVPLEMKVGAAAYSALDTDAGGGVQTNPLYSVGCGSAGGSFMRAAIILLSGTTPAWNPAVENKFRFGTSFKSAGATTEAAYWILTLRLA